MKNRQTFTTKLWRIIIAAIALIIILSMILAMLRF